MRNFFERLKFRTIWSWHGVKDTWVNEYSFRTWVWGNLISGGLAFWLLEGAALALILVMGLLVLAAELMNTAIERTVDLVTEEQHPLAKRAKDAGSAAVAVTAVAAGIAWVVALFV
ncbi:diacylglycerol kinase [Marivivens sp. LCG002]|uniref:diacylglycerol kinase n=1 Tax=Marivivens sp. LCG002 TaxID=3051171 RepID=UPI0025564505|nr:diacylglycerol kinase [Marivivens sp. LCG002]WIV51395.1 diacylglycerol kinase [Marivivens sp. LCG002]